MSSSFNGIDSPLASLYNLKSRKFHLVIYQSVTIHCHPSIVDVIGLKALCFLLCWIIEVFKRKGENPRIHISIDWLNVKRLHCRHSKIVKWLNQAKHTLWGSFRRDLQNIGWGRVSYRIFQKRDSQSVFSIKRKKIKIIKIGKNVMNIVQTSIALHCCIQNPHLLHFKIKVACICILKK